MVEVIKTEKYQRGTFGTFIKWAFIAFNVVMLVWIIGGFHAASTIEVHSNAERAGRAIGSAIGVASLLTLWVFGDVILGVMVLFTRGTKVIVEKSIERTSPLGAMSTSGGDFSKADELIAQLKRQQAEEVITRQPQYARSQSGAGSTFGKRR
ncbi:hypothetical protein JQ580_25915 [Bradyrhizobium japonicum]|uniref:hypothetical protein n=1 Tax=Bradyrhizobium japonicum TaxID=375 RepID=UPI001BA78219|nr:hypothetical protein [Bradyrhizobium japonicum]MBR0994163.1 hypothetical protein [Bradyrhizobium japonicum]